MGRRSAFIVPATAGNRAHRDPSEGREAPGAENRCRDTREGTLSPANLSTNRQRIANLAADGLAAVGSGVGQLRVIVRLRGAGKKGTAAAGAAERERVRTLGVVGMNPACDRISPGKEDDVRAL